MKKQDFNNSMRLESYDLQKFARQMYDINDSTIRQTLPDEVADLAGRVQFALGEPRRLGVAFSGGVDSSVLLALATRSLGADRTLAILGVSASLAGSERRAAHEVAAGIGVAPRCTARTRRPCRTSSATTA